MKVVQTMQAYLEQLAVHIRLTDVLDIAVIACLLYCGFAWFRNRTSRALAVGIGLIAVLYLAARWLNMYLTMWLFQAGVTATVLTLIVIFQHDIRRAFERLATSNPLHRPTLPGAAPGVMHTLVEGIVTLAERRTGALIVSEERGTISLAERGHLREIHPRELISCLERTPASRMAPATEGRPEWFSMIRHPGLKLSALLSAVS